MILPGELDGREGTGKQPVEKGRVLPLQLAQDLGQLLGAADEERRLLQEERQGLLLQADDTELLVPLGLYGVSDIKAVAGEHNSAVNPI